MVQIYENYGLPFKIFSVKRGGGDVLAEFDDFGFHVRVAVDFTK
jgi:hypothetical protein